MTNVGLRQFMKKVLGQSADNGTTDPAADLLHRNTAFQRQVDAQISTLDQRVQQLADDLVMNRDALGVRLTDVEQTAAECVRGLAGVRELVAEGMTTLEQTVDENTRTGIAMQQGIHSRLAEMERSLADTTLHTNTFRDSLYERIASVEATVERNLDNLVSLRQENEERFATLHTLLQRQGGVAHAGTGAIEARVAFEHEGVGPYPEFLREARKVGLDVNDYGEQYLAWPDVVPILERMVVPYLRPDSTVCELGPGTGRWSRHLVSRLPEGRLHLVDYSSWFVNFLKEYFEGNPRIVVQQTDGFTLPFPVGSCLDLIVSFSTLVMMNAGTVLCYAREFKRTLKPGGHCIVEYLDMSTPEGWEWCQVHAKPESATTFAFYTPEMMQGMFETAGLEIIADDRVAEWHPGYPFKMLVARCPDRGAAGRPNDAPP